MSDPLDRIEKVLIDHVQKYNADHLDVCLKLQKVETRVEAEIRRIDEHDEAIELSTADRNKVKGILWFLGILWVVVIVILGFIIS